MSGVRIHFWQVVTLLLGGTSAPVNHFFIGAIPELINKRLASFFGTSEKLPNLKHPFDSKKLKSITKI